MDVKHLLVSILTNHVTACTFLVYFMRRIFAAIFTLNGI
jgi:hypothetical protein